MKKALENKKIVLGAVTMLLIFAIIIVSSFWPFILDPHQIMTEKFLTDELIITSIVLSVTISMMFLAQASNANNPNSELARSKVEFKRSMERITNHTDFFSWIRKTLQMRDRTEIAKREMAKMLLPYDLYEMDPDEIMRFKERCELNGKLYGPYEESRLKRVIALKKAIAKVRFVEPSYYTSVRAIEIDKTLSELAVKESARKIFTVVIDLASRVIMTWMFASILGSFVRDLTQEGGSNAQAWMTFFTRAFSFGSSMFLGYNLGCKLNDIDAFYISKRVEVHTLYLEGSIPVAQEVALDGQE